MSINNLDDIDKNIITMLQNDPSTTHSKMAHNLSRSQPAIGARVKKLTKSGILGIQMGINFQQVPEYNLVKVEMSCSNPEEVFRIADECPYIINVFKLSGNRNLMVFLACSSLKRIDSIVDQHFRRLECIHNIHMDLVTKIAKKMILPLVFSVDDFKDTLESCKCRQRHSWNLNHQNTKGAKAHDPHDAVLPSKVMHV